MFLFCSDCEVSFGPAWCGFSFPIISCSMFMSTLYSVFDIPFPWSMCLLVVSWILGCQLRILGESNGLIPSGNSVHTWVMLLEHD